MANTHDFTATTIDGTAKPLKDYAGKALLIVNVASQCGLTPQYAGLQELHEKYGARGLAVLGFPCNQFGGQEPGSEGQIKTFCETKFGVTFPMFAKVEVNGAGRHPLYAFLTSQSTSPDGARRHPVELRQVPHRQGRHRDRALRADGNAGVGGAHGGDREGAVRDVSQCAR